MSGERWRGRTTEILHLVELGAWAARPAGAAYFPPSLAGEGFVHCSPDVATALAVADHAFAASREPLVAVVIDTRRAGHEVRWEAAAPAPPPGVDPATRFPHLYGPIEPGAVSGVLHARRDSGGGRYIGLVARPPLARSLGLLPHPEGGWFRRTWTAPASLEPPGYGGQRASASAVLYLLGPGERSVWHRVRSDELWLWHRGGPLGLRVGGDGERPLDAGAVVLGPAVEQGQAVQALVPGGTWQTASAPPNREVLVSCVVSPGYDDADFSSA